MQLTLILAITVVPVALPGIEAAFDATGAELILVNSAYGLTFGGLLLVGGRLSDRLGRKRIFTSASASSARRRWWRVSRRGRAP